MSVSRVVSCVGIRKRYGAVNALCGVDLELWPSEIVSLVGANGAGKSTLIKVIAGVVAADDGVVLVDGEPLPQHNVRAALAAGIAVVHQELNLVQSATVGENILLSNLPRRAGFVRRREVTTRAREVLADLEVDLDPSRPVAECTAVEQRLVMVAAALSQDVRVLILDEPTASLPPEDARHVLEAAKRLRSLGKTVVFVSHRLHEVRKLSDRAVIMRDGAVVDELRGDAIEVHKMVQMLGGRTSAEHAAPHAPASSDAEVVVAVRGLGGNRIQGLDLDVRAGEILGIAGLVGSGRSELLRLLGGVQPHSSGELEFEGERIRRMSDRQRRLGYVGEDRGRNLFGEFDVAGNLSLPSLHRLSRARMVRRRHELRSASEIVEQIRLKGHVRSAIWSLSGGNKQKVLLGRWLMSGARVLLLDEPTAGIDVASRGEVYELLREVADTGGAVVVAIADPSELLAACDRVVVLCEGLLTLEARRPFDEAAIMSASYSRHDEPVVSA